MATVAPIGNLLLLTARLDDLEKQMTDKTMLLQRLSAYQLQAMGMYTNLSSGIPQGGSIEPNEEAERYLASLHILSGQVEMDLKALESEREQASKAYESAEKLVDNNVKKDFKIFMD